MLYLTNNAETRIKKWLKENNAKSIRLSMKTAGCTGLMYEVVIAEDFEVTKDFAVKYDGFDLLIEHEYL